MNGVPEYGLIGDSSLYLKKRNRKKATIHGDLRESLDADLEVDFFPGMGISRLLRKVEECPGYEVLGISYFGNEHTERPLQEAKFWPLWQRLFEEMRHKCRRAVFFMGGYSSKYGLSRVYDENMRKIRGWISGAGFK
ncbi:unnamed protein product, partial [Effrenium voratum]